MRLGLVSSNLVVNNLLYLLFLEAELLRKLFYEEWADFEEAPGDSVPNGLIL